MKDLTTITNDYVINDQHYKVQMFTSTTEAEKKIAEHPFIGVHHGFTEKDLPLNGLQMLISASMDELVKRMRFDSHRRNFFAQNPDASNADLMKYLMQHI